jgi:hypothetical protein
MQNLIHGCKNPRGLANSTDVLSMAHILKLHSFKIETYQKKQNLLS